MSGLAFGGAGLAALGLAGCSKKSDGSSDALVDRTLPEQWDYETDIVVVGFGGSGSCAAVNAAANGASVIILEKMNEALSGGDTCCNAGVLLSPDPDSWIGSSLGVMSREQADLRAAATIEASNWVKGLGIKMARNGYQMIGGAPEFYRLMSKAVLATENVQVMYETPATGLVQDVYTKEIKGVKATQNGKEIVIKAKKGVILCCGDYSANPAIVEMLHWPKMPMFYAGTPAATGEGALMAFAAGAKMTHADNSAWDWFEFAFRKPSEEMGTGVTSRWLDTPDGMTPTEDNSPIHDSKIYVNMEGKRFMNEKESLQHNKTTLAFTFIKGALWDAEREYINMPAFWVCDDDCFKSAPWGKVERDETPWTWSQVKQEYIWSDDNIAELNKGWILKADTLEELAAKMTSKKYITGSEVTVPAENLVETVAKYNAGCEAGTDEFGRRVDKLLPLKTPPYYAIELAPACLYALGLLETNAKGEVVSTEDTSIPRLYAAGNIGQGLEFFPLGVAGCMGMGWLAGANAAALEAWE